MSQTYSTRQRDLTRGQLFSSRFSEPPAAPVQRPVITVTLPPPGVPAQAGSPPAPALAEQQPAPVPPEIQAAPAPALAPEQRLTYVLSPQGVVPTPPGAAQAKGAVSLAGRPGSPYTVLAAVSGLQPHRDSAIQPTLWLIHDLKVPADLAPADLALLPKGVALTGNRPGAVFTVDGNSPTYSRTSNTLSIAISPGTFAATGPTDWGLNSVIDAATNQAFHPLVVLGPSVLADINVPLPSGTVARILTDLFMRPATVHPNLNLKTEFAERLTAVAQDVLAAPGALAYLDPAEFTRAAVTMEGIVRGTARLQPTREACVLIGAVQSGA